MRGLAWGYCDIGLGFSAVSGAVCTTGALAAIDAAVSLGASFAAAFFAAACEAAWAAVWGALAVLRPVACLKPSSAGGGRGAGAVPPTTDENLTGCWGAAGTGAGWGAAGAAGWLGAEARCC